MFGQKINEFDNSDGTIESFNKIFPNTPLEGEGDVEILGIVDLNIFNSTVYHREIQVNGVVKNHDFGYNNFNNEEIFQEELGFQFKYFVKDLDGKVIAKGFSFDEISEQVGVSVGILKRRIKTTVTKDDNTPYKFNVTRIEL